MVSFGFEEEQREFEKRNTEFIKRFHHFVDLLPRAFPDLSLAEAADGVIYMLSRTCAEDFQEILLLCGNGYGIGAEKLLRGMYERAVTLVYLHEHPEEAKDFLDYHKVADHKLLVAVEDSMGTDVFSAEQKARIEMEFREVSGTVLGNRLRNVRHPTPQPHMVKTRFCKHGTDNRGVVEVDRPCILLRYS